MSSSESSSALESPVPSSPEASFQQGPPSLERIVRHFVAAKRSLASTSHVWRANEVVTRSRALVEEIAVLNAKNAYTRQGVDDQLETLQEIRDGVAESGEAAGDEFIATVATLDQANDRLQSTLKKLKQTVVDASLQRTSNAESTNDTDPDDEDEKDMQSHGSGNKTLYEFIDETRHTDILQSLHALIDSYNDARGTLDETFGEFDESVRTIVETLQEAATSGSGPQTKRTLYDSRGPTPTMTQLFRGMEGHAAEMATLLESLVSHYDLCVTALKHTEGGGEAAKRAMQQADAALLRTEPGAEEESLYQKTAPEPISDEERTEMLRVLESDAGHVEDVGSDMKDHSEAIEAQYEQLTRYALEARANYKALRNVFDQLHTIKATLPGHIEASREFSATWQSIRLAIAGRTGELTELRGTFDEFLASYAGMLRELDRRTAVEAQMRKVAAKAQKDLDKLYVADREVREEFTSEVGVSLPGDIWPGVGDAGVRWEVRPAQRTVP
ncbi:autophagy protein 17 [Elasticomyces elasticus]|nr:autophagy protein 17 [Elasticomyces elasticus]